MCTCMHRCTCTAGYIHTYFDANIISSSDHHLKRHVLDFPLDERVRKLPPQKIPETKYSVLVVHDLMVLSRLSHGTLLVAKRNERPKK